MRDEWQEEAIRTCASQPHPLLCSPCGWLPPVAAPRARRRSPRTTVLPPACFGSEMHFLLLLFLPPPPSPSPPPLPAPSSFSFSSSSSCLLLLFLPPPPPPPRPSPPPHPPPSSSSSTSSVSYRYGLTEEQLREVDEQLNEIPGKGTRCPQMRNPQVNALPPPMPFPPSSSNPAFKAARQSTSSPLPTDHQRLPSTSRCLLWAARDKLSRTSAPPSSPSWVLPPSFLHSQPPLNPPPSPLPSLPLSPPPPSLPPFPPVPSAYRPFLSLPPSSLPPPPPPIPTSHLSSSPHSLFIFFPTPFPTPSKPFHPPPPPKPSLPLPASPSPSFPAASQSPPPPLLPCALPPSSCSILFSMLLSVLLQ